MRKIFLLVFLLASGHVFTQAPADVDFARELAAMDSLLFERGYNNCDLGMLDRLLAEDVEMYHDQAGPMRSKRDFIDAVRQNICGREDARPLRKLVPGSLVHYPLFENGVLYGGVQQGRHAFFIRESSGRTYATSKARFIHLWLLEDGKWKLARVMSFDHQLAPDR